MLIETWPASIRRARRTALPTSAVHTEATRPYWVPLAIRSASSSSSAPSTESTGPKISSWAMRISDETSSKIVGATKKPPSYPSPASLPPPTTTVAPSSRPLSR